MQIPPFMDMMSMALPHVFMAFLMANVAKIRQTTKEKSVWKSMIVNAARHGSLGWWFQQLWGPGLHICVCQT